MDNKNSGELNTDVKAGSSRLTLPARIAFLAAVFILGFAFSTGALGVFGIFCGILAASLNIVIFLDSGNSAPWLTAAVAVNLAVCASAAVYSHSFGGIVTAIYPLVMSVAVFVPLRMKMGRSVSIAASAFFGTVLLLITFAVSVYRDCGALNAEAVNAALDGIYGPIIEYYNDLFKEISEKANMTVTAVDTKVLLHYTKSMLIGSVSMVMIILSYFVTLGARVIASVFGRDSLFPEGVRVGVTARVIDGKAALEIYREPVKWRIELDSVSAAVYIAVYAVSVLFATDSGVSIPLMVAENLIFILSPGFFYCGARDVVLGLRGKASMGRMSRFVLIPALILSIINPATVVILLCALGVIVTFRENGARRKMKDNGKEIK